MSALLWIAIVVLFALSIAGVFFPVIPDTLLLWAGFLLYQFALAEPGAELPASFWWGMVVMTGLLLGSDLFTNLYFVKKYGGSKWSSLAALAGVVLGVILLGPIGILVLPFVFVLAVEWGVNKQPPDKAFRVALGSLAAFLSSAVIKVLLQLLMIVWFFLAL